MDPFVVECTAVQAFREWHPVRPRPLRLDHRNGDIYRRSHLLYNKPLSPESDRYIITLKFASYENPIYTTSISYYLYRTWKKERECSNLEWVKFPTLATRSVEEIEAAAVECDHGGCTAATVITTYRLNATASPGAHPLEAIIRAKEVEWAERAGLCLVPDPMVVRFSFRRIVKEEKDPVLSVAEAVAVVAAVQGEATATSKAWSVSWVAPVPYPPSLNDHLPTSNASGTSYNNIHPCHNNNSNDKSKALLIREDVDYIELTATTDVTSYVCLCCCLWPCFLLFSSLCV